MTINLKGAYTRLRDNSKSAMMAAIEVYNKPSFDYRDECCVILLVNAWELILKSLLSKQKKRIYYPKKRNEDYRTFSLRDSLRKAESLFPTEIEYVGVKANLEHLADFRDKAIHFYNVEGFAAIVYNLAQACIKNYSDLLRYSFGVDLADEINIVLLPLSIGRMPLDPIQFIDEYRVAGKYSSEVSKFLQSIGSTMNFLESQNIDTTSVLVSFSIRFESVKKTKDAAAVVAVDNRAPGKMAHRRFDPNDFIREKDILSKLPSTIDGVKVNQHTFRGFVYKNDVRNKPHLYWRHDDSGLTTYSPELIATIRNTPGSELKLCREEYSDHLRRKARSR